MENKDLIDALEQIPQLVSAASIFKNTSDQIVSILAAAIKKRPQAEIPQEELRKIEKVVAGTRCAPPDMNIVARHSAKIIAAYLTESLGPALNRKVEAAMKDASVKVEHSHYIERNLKDVADREMRKKAYRRGLMIFVLAVGIILMAIKYFTGLTYWGKQYNSVYQSNYVTKEEKEAMVQHMYSLYCIPKNYYDSPDAAKLQIKRDKEIIKKRKKEARKNKGSFSLDERIE